MPPPSACARLREGVELDDGLTAPAARARRAAAPGGRSALEIAIHEGRNRQVRRMCDAVGHPVRRLVRTRIGPLTDTRLAPGRVARIFAERGARALRSRAIRAPGREHTSH